jgi:hypothetical protein
VVPTKVVDEDRHPHPQELGRFFDGLGLLDPGVVSTTQWRPDPADPNSNQEMDELRCWAHALTQSVVGRRWGSQP